ncbi:MAG: CYTH domain-containing protein [Lachnospiraceae bacterium]|nr:CYTH domain-containing protein [Lachnospiraceae bacterium]
MEIERKYLVDLSGIDIEAYPSKELEQGYLSTIPVVRVRREGEEYYLTYKSGNGLVRVEENLPLTKESYEHLLEKADGYVITKRRYRIPVEAFFDEEERQARVDTVYKKTCEDRSHDEPKEDLAGNDLGAGSSAAQKEYLPDGKTVELDVFSGEFEGVVVAEIEFPTKEAADAFVMPKRFRKEVTFDPRYINAEMSKNGRAGMGEETPKA